MIEGGNVMKINQVTGSSPIDKVIQPQRGYDAPKAAPEPVKVKLDPEITQIQADKMDKKPAGVLEEDRQQQENMLEESVKQANKTLKQYNRYIEREIHEVTHAVMYKLMDYDTKEVIAEFPPKKIQDMIAKMWELAGLFVDEKA